MLGEVGGTTLGWGGEGKRDQSLLTSSPTGGVSRSNSGEVSSNGVWKGFGAVNGSLVDVGNVKCEVDMRIWITTAVVAIAVVVGCFRLLTAAPPVAEANRGVGQPSGENKRACPKGHALRQVTILVGLPSAEMIAQMKQGKALLGGCMGVPGSSGKASVCEQCRQWKTEGMAYWQPLPKDFGSGLSGP